MTLAEMYAARTPAVVKVDVPPDHGEWFVRELDAASLTRFHQRYDELKTSGKELLWFACLAACDKDGNRAFADGDIDGLLLRVPGWLIVEVWVTGGKLNKLTKGAIEETEKNSQMEP